ncbi:MAG: hypothetical protein ACI3W5_00770 [Faecousia sp.]
MVSMFYAAIMGLLWIVNLFNGTGLDEVYHVTQLARYAVIFLTVGVFILKGNFIIQRKDFTSFVFMIAVFCVSSFYNGYGFEAVEYLWVFGLVYLLSHLPFDDKAVFWTGVAYGAGGLFILYVYNYGTTLSGWNDNSIAMIGMHSFLMMLIPLSNRTSSKSKALILILGVVFAALLDSTNSRSGILFTALGVIFALNLLPRILIYGRAGRITLCLVLPLMIAAAVVGISGTAMFESLEAWSFEKFNKPIFNGRDNIWRYGFDVLFDNFWIGAGSMGLYNWHNSAVTCLTAYGAVGYCLWISSFKNILKRARGWLNDYIIQGCVVSFLILYVQQSVELGFISSKPILLPYVMLGMMLGRIRYLRRCEGFRDA